MRVGIVGSRDFPYPHMVREFVRTLAPDTTVVSGAGGVVDLTAADEARKLGLTLIEFPADWEVNGKEAGMLRNSKIAQAVDELHAFMDEETPGTADTIRKCKSWKIPVQVHHSPDY